jgi:hypothetical protein
VSIGPVEADRIGSDLADVQKADARNARRLHLARAVTAAASAGTSVSEIVERILETGAVLPSDHHPTVLAIVPDLDRAC